MKRAMPPILLSLALAVLAGCSKTPSAPAPIVIADATPDAGAPPLSVKFSSEIEGGTPPLTYTWTFGDGSPTSAEEHPEHVYQKSGQFTAKVEVRDANGRTGSDELDVTVEAAAAAPQ